MKTAETELRRGVAVAVSEFSSAFGDEAVSAIPDSNGGAYVTVQGVGLGDPYVQQSTWVGFYLSDACPEADTYPFYVRGDLSRRDGMQMKAPIHRDRCWPENVPGMESSPAVMVSRRQNHGPSCKRESPLVKMKLVIKWMLEQ